MRAPLRLVSLLGILALLLLGGAATAVADPPLRAAERVTDRAGALDAAGVQRVAEAIEALRSEKRIDLFVVFVESFDGLSGRQWADETSRLSDLGTDDVLMAVATGDRAYDIVVGTLRTDLTQDRFDGIVSSDVEPALAAGDWAGAAVALADGLRRGGAASAGGGGVGTGVVVVGGLVVVGGGAYLLSRRRRRERAAGSAEPTLPTPTAARDEFSDVSTEDLTFRASESLLAVDDAVRRSEQELAAARAHFGDEAVAPFAAALAQSRADMLRAFEIRQQLDDDVPETDPQQRAMNIDIVRSAGAADARLDAQIEAFDRLRALEANAPAFVEGLGQRLTAVQGRMPQVEQAWSELRARYTEQATAPIAGNVAQAAQLLTGAGTEIAEAHSELAATGPAAAVVSGRAAEDALTQAETLLDGVGRRGAELAEAAQRYPAAKIEIEQDLAEARALATQSPHSGQIAPLVARAEAALAAADEAAAAQRPDPFAALRLLDEANTALDAGIADARAAADRERRAAAALEQALLTARSSVAAAADFVDTRRGAVGGPARTRLTESQRHLHLAQQGSDPAAALREAQIADQMAQEALRLAQSDVSRWSGPGRAGTGRTGADIAVDIGGMVLGGILSGAVSGGGGGRGRGGGFGGTSRGGGFRTGGRF